MNFDLNKPEQWGVVAHGATLRIDDYQLLYLYDSTIPVSIDVETDEQDHFVGLALCSDPSNVWYFTRLTSVLVDMLVCMKLVAHNAKSDLHFLWANGVNVKPEKIVFDTCVAAYLINPLRDSHALKALAKDILKLEWPNYDDMTTDVEVVTYTKGKRKPVEMTKEVIHHVTLDKRPVVQVANYCGMDCLATWRLYQHFTKIMTPNQKRIFEELDMDVMRCLALAEHMGVMVDVDRLKELERSYSEEIESLRTQLQALV